MRTIKFRAWQDNSMLIQKTPGVYGTKNFLNQLYEDCELMQFTGVKDKNNKEIYEGDIFKTFIRNDDGDKFERHYQVVFNDTNCQFMVLDTDSNGSLFHYANNCEVIGNIHENPELLK